MANYAARRSDSCGDQQMRIRCGAICLIALFVALSDQKRGASKQLAPGVPYTHLLTGLLTRQHTSRLPLFGELAALHIAH
jgi:hypothetical protein